MKTFTDIELEDTLKELASAQSPQQVDVVDKVMASIQATHRDKRFTLGKERRVRLTIGASLAAASVALLLFVGNGNSSQAQNVDEENMAQFISAIYNRQNQADVVFYTPDYIDILLGIDESL